RLGRSSACACRPMRLARREPARNANARQSFGNSLLPTIVRFMPICTVTGLPATSIVVLPLRYQPNEPVENSLTSAMSGASPILTLTGLACWVNSARVTGQLVLAMVPPELSASWETPRLRSLDMSFRAYEDV